MKYLKTKYKLKSRQQKRKVEYIKKNVKKDKLKIEGNGQKLKTYLCIIYDDNDIIELP